MKPQPGGQRLRELFGRRVRELRTRRRLTQQQLGEMAGMHPAYIGGVERGERNITLDGVERLAHALGVSPAELVARPSGVEPQALETRFRDLALQARDPAEVALALDVASFLLERLGERRRPRWAAAERPDG